LRAVAVAEEAEEEGDGNSVIDGNNSDLLDEVLVKALQERCTVENQEDMNAVDNCYQNTVELPIY
jgi:hypothetical protein